MDNSLLNPKTLKAVILYDALKKFLYSNKNAYNISKIKLFKCFIDEFCDYAIKVDQYHKFETRRDVKQALATLGIDGIDGWINFLTQNKAELEKQGFKINCFHIKEKHVSETKFYNVNSAPDEVRDVVVRSKYGNYPVLICKGVLTGVMSGKDNPQVAQIKIDYHYETGCPYYEVRPILYSTWADLAEDDPRRNCTCQTTDISDELEDSEDF